MQKKKKKLKLALALFVLCAMFAITGTAYVMSINNTLKAESYAYLNEVAQQSAKSISNKLNGDMRMLRTMAVMLGSDGDIDITFWVDALKREGLFEEFQHIEIILPNGLGYGGDVSGTDFSDSEYFKQAMEGNYYISDVMIDRISKELSNTYAVPIYHEGEIIAVLAATTHTNTYKQILFHEVFGGSGYTYVVTNSGAPVVRSNHDDSDKTFSNLFNTFQASEDKVKQMKSNMLLGHSGTLDYMARGTSRFLSYAPLGINDWYVISVIPKTVVSEKSQAIIHAAIISCLVVFLLFISLIISIIWTQYNAKKKLSQLAYYDDLTGISSKNLFKVTADNRLANRKKEYAYVILNICKFKFLNDKFGFTQGDLLLKHIAHTLDIEFNGDELAARFYADEFHILCVHHSKAELEKRLKVLADAIADFTILSDANYHITMGFGVYVIKNTDMSVGTIGDMAGLALKKTKENYLTSVFFYNEDIRNQLLEEQEIENDMRHAIDYEEFQVYLQPKYSPLTEEIQGAEALVRWLHPTKGLLSPDSFIPIFEKNSFITTLDMYMMEHVCKQLRAWIDEGKEIVPVSVNQSRLHLYNPNYINTLLSILRKYNISPSLLEIEITESVFFEDTDLLIDIVNKLHALDFRISMDDFGSGYSSLNMLQEIMVDVLKVDRIFFRESSNTERGRKIVSNIISMAADLNIQVVAEGVETIEQLTFLKQTGCDLVQGYYYAKPMPIEEFTDKIKNLPS